MRRPAGAARVTPMLLTIVVAVSLELGGSMWVRLAEQWLQGGAP